MNIKECRKETQKHIDNVKNICPAAARADLQVSVLKSGFQIKFRPFSELHSGLTGEPIVRDLIASTIPNT